MTLPKLLITGCGGLIGQILWRNLADTFDLYGVDICPKEQTNSIFQADIANLEQVQAVFAQIPRLTYVVHLAGDPRGDAHWQSVFVNNIVGTRNVYEAAKAQGIKRIIFASSNHVTGAYEGLLPNLSTETELDSTLITARHTIRPDSYYGVSKAVGEALARMYYELYGLESVCLRIGSVLPDDDPTRDARHQSTWLSHLDLVQLVKKSLLAEVKFSIYYGVSKNKHRFWDISDAVVEIGYQPVSDASTCCAKRHELQGFEGLERWADRSDFSSDTTTRRSWVRSIVSSFREAKRNLFFVLYRVLIKFLILKILIATTYKILFTPSLELKKHMENTISYRKLTRTWWTLVF